MENETIHISKESMDAFNHDKNVVDMTFKELFERHLECPINNGSDLNSDAMLDCLFDDGQYVENRVNGEYVALGFIDGVPARCEYELGSNFLYISPMCASGEGRLSFFQEMPSTGSLKTSMYLYVYVLIIFQLFMCLLCRCS